MLERIEESSGGVSLRDAKVVVSGGRGVGSAEGFAIIEELAGLLGGAVGCSRVVTSAGWRPHTDQVGQTGTKISADLYVACGISGATQHIAGAKGAKKILAINTDPEAPILAVADYAVIGDLHEVVPAISAELRKVRPHRRACARRAGGVGRPRRGAARRLPLRPRRAAPSRTTAGRTPRARRSGARDRARAAEAAAAARPGLMHAFIFWGFLVLLPTILMAMVAAVDGRTELPWLGGQEWFGWLRTSSACSCSPEWRPPW